MADNVAAPDDEKLARELARQLDEELAQELARSLELDEKLAQELARKLELEDSLSESDDAYPGQLKIMHVIREEAQRKEIEKALQDSGTGLDSGSDSEFFAAQKAPATTAPPYVDYVLAQQQQQVPRPPIRRYRSLRDQRDSLHRVSYEDTDFLTAPRAPGTTAPPHVDYLLAQLQATGEWQQVQRPPIRRHRPLRDQRDAPHQVSFEHYAPHSSDEVEARPKEESLSQKERMKTIEAIRACVYRPPWRTTVKRLAAKPLRRGQSRGFRVGASP